MVLLAIGLKIGTRISPGVDDAQMGECLRGCPSIPSRKDREWEAMVMDELDISHGLVWCYLASHAYTQYDNPLTRVWHKAYEDDLKMI